MNIFSRFIIVITALLFSPLSFVSTSNAEYIDLTQHTVGYITQVPHPLIQSLMMW